MSFTDGMSKTPGIRQHNKGWARIARQQRRAEAADRNARLLPTPRAAVKFVRAAPASYTHADILLDLFAA